MFDAIETLIKVHEREHLLPDEPDDSDISVPPSGITMGMIRAARAEMASIAARRMTFQSEWYLSGLRHGPGEYVLTRIGPADKNEIPF